MTIENRKELIARISRAMKKQYEDAESYEERAPFLVALRDGFHGLSNMADSYLLEAAQQYNLVEDAKEDEVIAEVAPELPSCSHCGSVDFKIVQTRQNFVEFRSTPQGIEAGKVVEAPDEVVDETIICRGCDEPLEEHEIVRPCIECGGKGWDLYQRFDSGVHEIERCDTCQRYPDDIMAGEVASEVIYKALKESQ